jgi:hypothetical protein
VCMARSLWFFELAGFEHRRKLKAGIDRVMFVEKAE